MLRVLLTLLNHETRKHGFLLASDSVPLLPVPLQCLTYCPCARCIPHVLLQLATLCAAALHLCCSLMLRVMLHILLAHTVLPAHIYHVLLHILPC